MIDDKALLSEYLSESEEMVEALLADLDLLAARVGNELDINLVNHIFRTTHSLKGLTGMMGLPEVQSLAHEFEDLLDDLRLGRLTLDEELAAALQEAGAWLASLVGGAAQGTASEEDYSRLQKLISAVASQSRARGEKGEANLEGLGLSESERRQLGEYQQHRISENLSAGRSFYSLSVQFEIGKLDTHYRALTSALEENGEIITTFSEKTKEPTQIGFKLLLATPLKEADVKRIAKPYSGRVARLGPSPWRRAGAALMGVGRKQKLSKKQGRRSDENINPLLPTSFTQESLQPLSPSVRVELSQIDELSGLAHELAIETQRLSSMADRFLVAAGFGARERFDLRLSARRIEREFLELEERLVELRMISLAQTFTRAARLAGRLARELGKSITVDVAGRETQLDKMIVDRIADPIYHVLRNALDHGIESPEQRQLSGKNRRGRIGIEASLEGARAVIAISDDGRGIDADAIYQQAIEAGVASRDEQLSQEEKLRLIFRPGFSTAREVSAVSGRGVGLDAVERTIHELGGEIRLSSKKGNGARFELAVPTTLVMISAFIVRLGEWRYAVNVGQIIELLYVSSTDIVGRDGKRSILWRGSIIPLVELRYLLGLGGARLLHQQEEPDETKSGSAWLTAREPGAASLTAKLRVPVLITRVIDRHVAIAVEEFEEQREIIVKSLGLLGPRIKGVTGAVDLEGGDVALVLDLPSLLVLRSLRL